MLMLCALGFLAGAVLLFVYGDPVFRPALGFGLAFSGFTFLSVLFPLADWPLRLLALLLVFSRRLRVADKLAVLALAPMLGLFSNAARIFFIVLLAAAAGDNYRLMHESVGIVLFFGTLAALWWLDAGLPERQAGSPEAQINSAIS